MASSAILAIRIIGDAAGAVSAMKKAQQATVSFKDQMKTAGAAAAAGLAAIGVAAKQCADKAADLQQSVGGVETVFGASSKQMLAWSKAAAQAVGLSQNEYNEFATLIGAQLQNMGMSMSDSAGKTNDLIKLGADLSSMFGGTTAEAVEALSSALKGENDPIEKYGITLNDTTLQAQAASMGLKDLYKQGDSNAKMQTILAAVTAQSGKAVGNFGREADTAQGQQQRMNAAWENAQATLGQALLPVLTQAAQWLAKVATYVQQNSEWLIPLVAGLGLFAAAIIAVNAAMTAYSVIAGIVTAVQAGMSLAFLPVIAAIGLVVAAIILMATHWEQTKQIAQTVATAIVVAIAALGAVIGAALSAVWGAVKNAAAQFVAAWQAAGAAFSARFQQIGQFAANCWQGIVNTCSAAVQSVKSFFAGLGTWISHQFDGVVSAVKNALGWVSDLWGKITGAKNAASGIGRQAMPITARPVVTAASPIATYGATPVAAYAGVTPSLSGAITSAKPTIVTINISVDAHDNLDNDKVAGNIVKALDSWASNRGKRGLWQ